MSEPIKLTPYSPTEIVGAKEVWDAGGDVYVIPLTTRDGKKTSTTGLIERILEVYGDGTSGNVGDSR